jgi:hypothetical protein
MKNILFGAIVLIFISPQAQGQQSQDALYLKRGYKDAGRLPEQSMPDFRFRSLDGNYFAFSSDDAEKIVTAQEIIMRKVNFDFLTADGINLYRDKATEMRTAGMIMTLAGFPIYVAGVLLWVNYALETPAEERGGSEPILYGVMTVGGAISTIAGITLWTTGSRRMKAEIALKAYNIKTDNSTAVGLGITLGF